MEIIPLLIFAFIGFNIFKGFKKTTSQSGGSAKAMMRRLHEEIEKASDLQNGTSHTNRTTPTQRGRESRQRQGKSPWGANGAVSPGASVATNYLKKSQTSQKKARRESHKSPKQYGRRGRNVDQNRNRTDEWGARGDGGVFSGKTAIIGLVIVGAVLYALSKMPAG